MGKSSPSIPAAPDPVATARAQAQENRLTQFLPGGTVLEFGRYDRPNDADVYSYEPRGGAALRITEGAFDERQRLARQNVADQLANRAIAQVGMLPTAPISFEGLAELPGIGGFGDERRATEAALFTRSRGLLDPVFEQREQALRQSLSNRGVPEGGEAFMTEMDLFNRDRSNAYENAALDAIRAGGAEQSRLMSIASAARNQALQERQLQRQMAFNELAALLGGQQLQPGSAIQNFVPPPAIDVLGPLNTQYQGALAGYQGNLARQQGLQSGLFNLGSTAALYAAPKIAAAIGTCSRSYKHNGRPVETILPRLRLLDVEAWDYLPGIEDSGTHIGPYAEDFHALFGVGNDKNIHVADAFGVCLLAIKELDSKVEAMKHDE